MSHEPSELTIIIVSFNSHDAIVRHQQQLLESEAFPCMVVDNASRDQSAGKLKESYPHLEVLPQPVNLGYGRAANIGIRRCKTRFALLLNPDIVAPLNEIKQLLSAAILDPENTAIWGPHIASRPGSTTAKPGKLASVNWVSGCAMLFDVARIKEVGLFDENIFLYSEDTELCERAVRAGFSIRKFKGASFAHSGGMSTRPDPDIDYLRWWHFGWSNTYRRSKSGNPDHEAHTRRKLRSYRLHSWLSLSRSKRRKWKAKADGTAACLSGSAAFDEEGHPMMQSR